MPIRLNTTASGIGHLRPFMAKQQFTGDATPNGIVPTPHDGPHFVQKVHANNLVNTVFFEVSNLKILDIPNRQLCLKMPQYVYYQVDLPDNQWLHVMRRDYERSDFKGVCG